VQKSGVVRIWARIALSSRATIYRALGLGSRVGLRSGACRLLRGCIDRRHRPAIGLAQSSRLVLSERIRPEHRLIPPRIPDEPIAPTKGPSSVAVGIVRLAGHVARFYSQ
jgi:hypothetical protein